MKKFLAFTFCLLLSFPFYSCDGNDPAEEPGNNGNETPEVPGGDDDGGNEDNGEILIVYFSRTGYNYPNTWLDVGHTARIAGYIADYSGGTSFEIVPVVPYPDSYDETTAIAREEMANNARPAIKNELEDLEKYATVFVGFPNWYGSPPMIMRTFFDTYDLSEKKIVPFCTHAGSGMGNGLTVIKEAFPQAEVLDGIAIRGTDSPNARETVNEWLNRIGIEKIK